MSVKFVASNASFRLTEIHTCYFILNTSFSLDFLWLGEVLWTTDKTRLHDGWNIYSPATVQDLDYDGVGEIVIAHGGDPVIPAEVRMVAWFFFMMILDHSTFHTFSKTNLEKYGFAMQNTLINNPYISFH